MAKTERDLKTGAKPGRVSMMPEQVERNKAVLRRYVDEAWNKRNPGAAKEFLAPNFVYNQITTNKKLAGYAGLEQAFRAFAAVMPDYQFDIKTIFGEGDMVAAYFTVRGTFKGELMGIKPTGQSLTFSAVGYYRFENGKIVEDNFYDAMVYKLLQNGAT